MNAGRVGGPVTDQWQKRPDETYDEWVQRWAAQAEREQPATPEQRADVAAALRESTEKRGAA